MCGVRDRERDITLLKLLVAIAWADGALQAAELNFLKRLILRLGLDSEVWSELEPYLEEPVETAERQELARHLAERLQAPGSRRQILEFLQQMAGADDDVTPEEREALEELRSVLQSQSVASGLIDGLKSLFRGGAPARASRELSRNVDTFLNNKVLYRLRRRLQRREAEVQADDRKLSYWALFGGLLGRVVGVDETIRAEEEEALHRVLAAHSDLDGDMRELVVSVVKEEALKGLDRYRLIQGFLEVSDRTGCRQLVDCLFDVATADRDLPREEHEEIRSIAYGLGLSHREFIAAKLPYTSRLREADPPA